MKRLSVCLLAGIVASITACAGSQPKNGEYKVAVESRPPATTVGGRLSAPMTGYEALRYVKSHQKDFDRCFDHEILTTGRVANASYIFALTIPPSGNQHSVELRKSTDKTAFALEECIRKRLQTIEFPSHPGKPLSVQVRVAAHAPSANEDSVASIEQAN